MDSIYSFVRKIKNPVLRRICYHLLQFVVGFVMGIFCAAVSRYFSKQTPIFDPKVMLIMGVSLGVGFIVLSLSWYSKAKQASGD